MGSHLHLSDSVDTEVRADDRGYVVVALRCGSAIHAPLIRWQAARTRH
jgi:hypothetical protein